MVSFAHKPNLSYLIHPIHPAKLQITFINANKSLHNLIGQNVITWGVLKEGKNRSLMHWP